MIKKIILISVMFIFSSTLLAIDENRYERKIKKAYKHLDKHFIHDSIPGVGDVEIAFAMPKKLKKSHNKCKKHNKESKALVIIPGRTEGYVKYVEVAYDLKKLGYNIYLFDLRGQGFSGRMIEDGHRGYIDSFDNYVADLKTFLDEVVQPENDKISILTHSLGGLVATRFIQTYPNYIDRAVLSSPMLEMNLGDFPEQAALQLAGYCSMDAGCPLIGADGQPVLDENGMPVAWFFGHDYVVQNNQGPRVPEVFEYSAVTTSRVRFNNWEGYILGEAYPEIAIGGVTYNWVKESIIAGMTAEAMAPAITTDVLMFQAGSDWIVKPERQNRVCDSAPSCELIVIEGARHEILMESDSMRNQAMFLTKMFLLK